MDNQPHPSKWLTLKRIIAREGLIIITLLLLASASYYGHSLIIDQKYAYESNAKEIEVVKEKKKSVADQPKIDFRPLAESTIKRPPRDIFDEISIEQEGTILIPQGIIVQFPKYSSDDIIEKTLKRDFVYTSDMTYIIMDNIMSDNINGYYDAKGNKKFNTLFYRINFLNVAIFFLFFAYPIYMVIRFILWAIQTLKETSNDSLN